MKTRKQKMISRILAVVIMLTMVIGDFAGKMMPVNASTEISSTSYQAATSTMAASNDYGLAENMQDGAILHAWCWSFDTIKANMKDIAEAGYTSIQTSPIMKCVVGEGGSLMFNERWYYHYQPTNYTIGNYQMGSEEQFKAMCDEAHKYGVKIVVDVVVNHMTSAWNLIESPWNNRSLFHTNEEITQWGNREDVTQKSLLGLWDLNTQNTQVQQGILAYLKKCVEAGADGFRYDAAKHIELPGEYGSNFWNVALNNGAEFQYGEVLQDSISKDVEYSNYMSVTASNYGKKLRDNIGNKNLSTNVVSSFDHGANKYKLVTWVESHDTYANAITDWGSSQWMNDWHIKMLWAVVGARDGGTPLFFSRPVGGGGQTWDNRFPEVTKIGDKGSDLFKDPEVAWVNHFRNAMVGESEYLRNYGGNDCLMIERGNRGVVIINTGSAKQLNSDTKLANGTYTDQVSGSTFTVSNGKISGQLAGNKVHVIFNQDSAKLSASPSDGTSFKTDSLDVTLKAANVKNARYETSEGASGSFTDGQVITIGAKTAVKNTITVTLTAEKEDGTKITVPYTYTKKDPNEVSVAYFYKPASWSKAYCYVYNDDPTAAVLKENAPWPGLPMTLVGDNIYSYDIPDDYDNPKVIFTNGVTGTSTKIPADGAEGVDEPGFSIDGHWIYDATGTWREYTEIAKKCNVTVNHVDTDGKILATDTLQGADGASYSTVAKTIDGYKLKSTPDNASGVFAKEDITVTYVYEKIQMGTVNVVYEDTDGNKIGSDSVTGEVGTSYSTTGKTITGYKLKTTPDNASGVFAKEDITVTYVYEKVQMGTVNVVYKDTDGNKLGSDGVTGEVGTAYTTKAKDFSKYKLVTTPDNASGVFTTDDITVTYIYEKLVVTANMIYFKKPSGWSGTTMYAYVYNSKTQNAKWPGVVMTAEGNGLYSYELPEGMEDGNVVFNNGSAQQTPASGGYSITNTGIYGASGLEGFYGNEDTAVVKTFYFEKPAAWGNDIKVYIYDIGGTKQNAAWPGLSMNNNGNGKYSYTIDTKNYTKAVVIFTDGSRQFPASGASGLTIINNGCYNLSGLSHLEAEQGTVNVFYKDQDGINLSSEVLTGEIGEAYTTKAKTIDGYDLVKTPENASGTFVSGTITVVYEYEKQVTDTVTVYLNKPSNWSGTTIYAYVYNATSKNAAWPGIAMTSKGNGLYSYEIPEGLEDGYILFNNGSGQQTPASMGYKIVDSGIYGTAGLEGFYGIDDNVTEKTFYFEKPADWGSNIRAYIYDLAGTKQNAAWPGVAMTNNGNGLYSYTLDTTGYTKPVVIFTDGSRQYPGSGSNGLTIINGGYYTSSGLSSLVKASVNPEIINIFISNLIASQNIAGRTLVAAN